MSRKPSLLPRDQGTDRQAMLKKILVTGSLFPLLAPVHSVHGLTPEQFFQDDGEAPSQIGTTLDGKQRFEIRGGYAITEGDIVLGKIAADGENTPFVIPRGIGRTSKIDRWTDGIVHYRIAPTLDSEGRAKVAEAVNHWNENSTVTIVELSDEEAQNTSDYILFEPSGGCASWVGKIGGEQAIWVGTTCTAGSVIHEIGHALGLFHEHTRSDRDSHINVMWDNIIDGKDFNFDVIESGAEDLLDYDYGSIMHYGPRFFSKNGADTIQVPDGIEIGQREALSATDLESVNRMYGTNLSLSSSVVADGQQSILNASINNLGDNGAHAVVFTMPATQANTLASFSGDGWSCQEAQALIRCERAILAEGSETTLQLVLNDPATADETARISSKTHDFDLSDNGAEPTLGGALPEPPSGSTEDGSGAGTDNGTGGTDSDGTTSGSADNSGSTGGGNTGGSTDPILGTDDSTSNENPAPISVETPVRPASGGSGGGSGWPIALLPILLWRRFRSNH